MDYKPDKFSKWAIRVVIFVFIVFALGFGFLKRLVLDQGPGEELWSKGNMVDAGILLLVCVVAGVAWALVNYVNGEDKESE